MVYKTKQTLNTNNNSNPQKASHPKAQTTKNNLRSEESSESWTDAATPLCSVHSDAVRSLAQNSPTLASKSSEQAPIDSTEAILRYSRECWSPPPHRLSVVGGWALLSSELEERLVRLSVSRLGVWHSRSN